MTDINITRNLDPAVTDDSTKRYDIGSEWTNSVSGNIFQCIDNTAGNAKWVKSRPIQSTTNSLTADQSKIIYNPNTSLFYKYVNNDWVTTNAPTSPVASKVADFHALVPVDNKMTGVLNGIGTLTATHADTINAPDYEGVYRPFITDEIVWQGGRYVENLAYYAKDPTNWTLAGTATVDSAGVTDPWGGALAEWYSGAINNSTNFVEIPFYRPLPVDNRILSIWIKGQAGGETVSLHTAYAVKAFTVTTEWKRYTFKVSLQANFWRWYALSGEVFSIIGPQMEIYTGRVDTVTPSELITTTTAAVKQIFSIENGNSVASNVVTEAEGEVIDKELVVNGGTDNEDGTYTFDGTGPYYGRFNGILADTITSPDSVAASVTGDIDLRAKALLDNWIPAADNVLISKQGSAVTRSYSLVVLGSTGQLAAAFSITGTSSNVAISSVTTGFVNGDINWARVTRDATTGTATFYTSSDGVIWEQLGTTVSTTSGNLSNQAVAVEIGTAFAGTVIPAAGKIYQAQVYDGIDGTLVVDYNARDNPTNAGTHISSTTGETWTWTNIASGRDEAGSWTINDAASQITVVNGRLRGTNGDATNGGMNQAITTIVDRKYTIELSRFGGSSAGQLLVGTAPGSFNITYHNSVNGDTQISFIAVTTTTYITLNSQVATTGSYYDWEYIRIHQESPDLRWNPTATNYAFNSRDLTGWTATGTLDATFDQVGIDGSPNSATKLTDNNAAAHEFLTPVFTVPSSTLITTKFWVLKDSDTTRYPGVGQRGGSPAVNLIYHVDTQNGTLVVDTVSGGTAPRSSIHSDGVWWVVCVEDTTTASTTPLQYIIPAYSTTQGTLNVATQGSAIFGQAEMHAGKTIEQVRYLPPVFTTTVADSIARTEYSLDILNHNSAQGVYTADYTFGADIASMTSDQGVLSLTPSSRYGPFYISAGANTFSSYATQSSIGPVQTLTAGDKARLAFAYNTTDMITGTNGTYGTLVSGSSDFLIGAQIEIGSTTLTTYPFGIKNIQYWDLPYDEAKTKGIELMR